MEELTVEAVFGLVLGFVVIAIAFAAVLAYPPLQYSAIRQLRGGWRAFALLPLVVMGIVVAVTVPALMAGSNLWPFYLIFITPFAAVYLLVLQAVHRFVRARGSKGGA